MACWIAAGWAFEEGTLFALATGVVSPKTRSRFSSMFAVRIDLISDRTSFSESFLVTTWFFSSWGFEVGVRRVDFNNAAIDHHEVDATRLQSELVVQAF